MNEKMREYTERLRDAQCVFEQEVIRCEGELRNVYFRFSVGLGAALFGLFILWLAVTDATLFVIGIARVKLEPLSYAVVGVFSTFLGCFLLAISIHIRIVFPSRIKNLKKKVEKLDTILVHQQTPRKTRQVLDENNFLSSLMEEERNRIEVFFGSLRTYGSSVGAFVAGFMATMIGLIEGYDLGALVLGGILILIGAVWAVSKYKKKQTKNKTSEDFTFDVEYGYQTK